MIVGRVIVGRPGLVSDPESGSRCRGTGPSRPLCHTREGDAVHMTRKLALVVLALALAGAAHAAGPDPIETRQAGQDLLNADFAGIRAVVAAKGDVKTLEKPAAAMARWMRQFPSQFPPGSDTG